MKIPEPFEHKSRWCVQLSAKLSPTGKRQQLYFDTEEAAKKDIKARFGEALEHGRSGISADERQMVAYARQQLGGDLRLLPEIIAHWKATGSGSVTPTTVADAVKAFQAWHIPKVNARTASDIRWRLDTFGEAFKGRSLHQINAGELEDWIHSHGNDLSVRSFYKRLRPLFDHALRRRWIAENPIELVPPPETPAKHKEIYTALQFHALMGNADGIARDDGKSWPALVPFLVLAGYAFMRTSELVRLYASEDVLRWEDILFDTDQIHVRETVGKATRRAVGNERVIPLLPKARSWLEDYRKDSGYVVDMLHHEFSEQWRSLHSELKMKTIPNGLRRSAISHALAAEPELSVVRVARWAGNSEATVKGHYYELLSQEQGRLWFGTKGFRLPK